MAKVLSTLKFRRQMKLVEKRHEMGMASGLKAAGLYLQAEAQKLTPVDTSALRNSARTTHEGSGRDTEVQVSFSTNYAIFVHENLNARHASGTQAKFLEKPAREKKKEMSAIVAAYAKIGTRL